jgi:hypothetical protein
MREISDDVNQHNTGGDYWGSKSTDGAFAKTSKMHFLLILRDGRLVRTEVLVSVNAQLDPTLARTLLSDNGLTELTTVRVEGEVHQLAQGVVFHDPELAAFVLVLPESLRHRAGSERAALLLAMADESVSQAPQYAMNPTVVFGYVGLVACLQRFAAIRADVQRNATKQQELESKIVALSNARDELVQERTSLRAEVAAQQARIELLQKQTSTATAVPLVVDLPTVIDAGEYEVHQRGLPRISALQGAVAEAVASGKQMLTFTDVEGNRDVVLLLKKTQALQASKAIWRFVMPRVDGYPLPAVIVQQDEHRAVFAFDAGNPDDVELLQVIAQRGRIVLATQDADGKLQRCNELAASLGGNIGYCLRSAREDFVQLPTAQWTTLREAAKRAVTADGFDLFGARHPEANEFRVEKLRSLQTVSAVRRAMAVAKRFAKPSREEYVVCTRGFSLAAWKELRKDLLRAAVAWGIWMGPELAQVAVAEGLARSRRDLIIKMDAGFTAAKRNAELFDIDGEAAADNSSALALEAAARGVSLKADEDSGVFTVHAAGEIENSAAPVSTKKRSIDDLIRLLDDKGNRVIAAIELCERADQRGATPVIESVGKMNRAEAVRVLGMSVRFGASAAPALEAGLRNSKAYLRHGCALALAMLRIDSGTVAVIELLLREPTDIWREIARAIGQLGAAALAPLQLRLQQNADSELDATVTERCAWAMAHMAVRGAKPALVELAQRRQPNGTTDVVSTIAARALELLPMAANDQVRIAPDATGTSPGRDITVNRAFSRQFFESLDMATPGAQPAAVDIVNVGEVGQAADDDMILDAELLEDEDAMEITDADVIG